MASNIVNIYQEKYWINISNRCCPKNSMVYWENVIILNNTQGIISIYRLPWLCFHPGPESDGPWDLERKTPLFRSLPAGARYTCLNELPTWQECMVRNQLRETGGAVSLIRTVCWYIPVSEEENIYTVTQNIKNSLKLILQNLHCKIHTVVYLSQVTSLQNIWNCEKKRLNFNNKSWKIIIVWCWRT